MPKQALILRKFNSGMVTAADTTDLPMETCTTSIGLETVKKIGSLSGMRGSEVDTSSLATTPIDDYVHITTENDVDAILVVCSKGGMYWQSTGNAAYDPLTSAPEDNCGEGIC